MFLAQRVFGIPLGYPDTNDARELSENPIHKLLLGRDPKERAALASQLTLSRFVVTNLPQSPKRVYAIYTERENPENAIHDLKKDLAMDRTSCARFLANQFRIPLTAAAYVLMQELRFRARHTEYARAQVATLRNYLFKIDASVELSVHRIVIHLPHRFPGRPAFLRIASAVGGIRS